MAASRFQHSPQATYPFAVPRLSEVTHKELDYEIGGNRFPGGAGRCQRVTYAASRLCDNFASTVDVLSRSGKE